MMDSEGRRLVNLQLTFLQQISRKCSPLAVTFGFFAALLIGTSTPSAYGQEGGPVASDGVAYKVTGFELDFVYPHPELPTVEELLALGQLPHRVRGGVRVVILREIPGDRVAPPDTPARIASSWSRRTS